MSDFDAAAAVNAQRVRSQVDMAILSKIHREMKQRDQAVAGLIESTLESAQQMQASEPGKGEHIDVNA